MKADREIEDAVSRKRLRRKVLDRWENEGGRLCEDPTSVFESGLSHTRDRKTLNLSPSENVNAPPKGKPVK